MCGDPLGGRGDVDAPRAGFECGRRDEQGAVAADADALASATVPPVTARARRRVRVVSL
ncbi:hypothetical protein [Streptomyces sp. NY05-11A]|uniref:hypothetical protein n=1 Tax=Streptomyces soliscabiei TaxID=588897 RepID=UPI003B9C6677